MSLLVWLPLNGNLENQGLNNITVTNNGATVDNNGKIGKCYSFNGGGNYFFIKNVLSSTTPNFSLCFWVNFTNTNTTATIYTARTSVGSGIALFRLAEGKFRFDDGNLQTYFSDYQTTTGWTHVCVTRDTVNKRLYINGELKQTIATVGDMTNIYNGNASIGASSVSGAELSNFLKGKLNDFRIYDHCLSPKEVKELAKGLVLHYRLAGPGQTNLLTGTGPNDSGWNVYQSGGTATKTVTNDCTTFNVIAKATQWFLYDHNLPSSIRNSLKTNTTYTYSFETKSNANFDLHITLRSPNGSNVISNSQKVSIIGDNEWHKYYVQLTTIASFSSLSQTDQFFYMSGGNIISTVSFRNAKFEEGSIATPWCPNPSDALYSTMGYNDNIEYDCSGYNRNGTKSGAIAWDINSARYTTSYKFNGNNTSISIPYKVIPELTNATFSAWFYREEYGTKKWESIFTIQNDPVNSVNNYFEIETKYSTTNNTDIRVYNGAGTPVLKANAYSLNKWVYIAVTLDSSQIKLYIDGVLVSTGASHTLPDKAQCWIGSYSSSQNFKGNISDFRVYATALSAEDIVELYHTAAMVDNQNNLYAYEYVEE